jgi:hypothetical protein
MREGSGRERERERERASMIGVGMTTVSDEKQRRVMESVAKEEKERKYQLMVWLQ